MDLHFSELAEKLKICTSSVRNYMARAEFSHILLKRGIYYGIEDKDLSRLKYISFVRKKRAGKQ